MEQRERSRSQERDPLVPPPLPLPPLPAIPPVVVPPPPRAKATPKLPPVVVPPPRATAAGAAPAAGGPPRAAVATAAPVAGGQVPHPSGVLCRYTQLRVDWADMRGQPEQVVHGALQRAGRIVATHVDEHAVLPADLGYVQAGAGPVRFYGHEADVANMRVLCEAHIENQFFEVFALCVEFELTPPVWRDPPRQPLATITLGAISVSPRVETAFDEAAPARFLPLDLAGSALHQISEMMAECERPPRYIIGELAGLATDFTAALAAAFETRVFHAGSAPKGEFFVVGETWACTGKQANDMENSAWKADSANALPGTSCSTWGVQSDLMTNLCVYIGRKRVSRSAYHVAREKARSNEWQQRSLGSRASSSTSTAPTIW